jgi:hypothetical protein
MQKTQNIKQKSRLGMLLIDKGYLIPQQLDQALRLQNETGVKLGERLDH